MNGEWIQGEPASHKGTYYLALLRRYYGGGREVILEPLVIEWDEAQGYWGSADKEEPEVWGEFVAYQEIDWPEDWQ